MQKKIIIKFKVNASLITDNFSISLFALTHWYYLKDYTAKSLCLLLLPNTHPPEVEVKEGSVHSSSTVLSQHLMHVGATQ